VIAPGEAGSTQGSQFSIIEPKHTMKKTWIIAAMLMLAVGTPAFAGKKDKNKGPDVFARYDTNGNGKLDPDEIEAIKKAFDTDPDLKKYDTNGDGKLDDNEIAAIKPADHKKKKKNAQ
jgi:hypothetical protein